MNANRGTTFVALVFNPWDLDRPRSSSTRQLKVQGALEGISEVMELGSQDFWCPQKNLVIAVGKAFGRDKVDPVLLNTTNASQQPARLLYEALGIKYGCVDVDGRVGSVVMDLNFDDVPAAHKSKYGLVTNFGTSEHIMNQYNVFKAMHEFARPGSVFVHAVPFTCTWSMASSIISRISSRRLRVTIPIRRSELGWDRTGRFRASFPGSPGCWSF